MEDLDNLIKELEMLKKEHQRISDEILQIGPFLDEMSMRRLKKNKLSLKDTINHLENIIYPDIIA
jgi:hypothetical protein